MLRSPTPPPHPTPGLTWHAALLPDSSVSYHLLALILEKGVLALYMQYTTRVLTRLARWALLGRLMA
jgi:hypothetical protein